MLDINGTCVLECPTYSLALNTIKMIIIGLDSFSNQPFNIFGPIWILLVFVLTTLLKDPNYSNSLWLHFAKSYRITEKD